MPANVNQFKQQSERFSLIRLRGKVPIEPQWEQHCIVKRSFNEIGFVPGDNAGIACGPASGVIVQDVDQVDLFESACRRNGWEIPDTRVHLTGRQLPHLLYSYPYNGGEYGNKSFKVLGFDIRGMGGQVVAPGSVHPDTGQHYTVFQDVEPAPAPQWFLDLYKADRPEWTTILVDSKTGLIKHSRVSKEIAELIRDGVQEGLRSEAMWKVIHALVTAGFSDDQLFWIFYTFNIGEKFRAIRHNGDGWLEKQINKARTTNTPTEGTEPAQQPSWTPSFPLTDFGNAERFAAQHKDKVRYTHSWGRWLIWSGKHWEIDETGSIRQLAKETARKMYANAAQMDDDDMRKRLVKHARECESAAKIASLLTLAQTEPGIATRSSDFDKDPWLLTVLNGTLNLRTGELSPHRREDLITRLAPVVYDAGAVCPLWLTFLDRVMGGSRALILYLQKLTGYSLTGDTREKCLPVLHGIGDNGKTIFTATIGGMLGDYAQETPVDSLMIKRGETIPNDIARLKGARLVTASEGERGQRLAESLIKRLTGGDKMSARFLHQEWFEFTPEFKIWLSTNHKPVVWGSDNAIWDRIHLIPFEVIIPKAEQIPRTVLLERLRGEWPGIMRWAVEGCLLWQKEGVSKPVEVEQATDDYRYEMDILAGFIGDCCVLNPLAKCKTVDLFTEYEKWCSNNREEPVTIRTLASILHERGFKKARVGSKADKGWQGIGIRSDTDRQTHSDPISRFFYIEKNKEEKNVKTGSASVCRSVNQVCSSCGYFTFSSINPDGFGVCSGEPPDGRPAKLPTDGPHCPAFARVMH